MSAPGNDGSAWSGGSNVSDFSGSHSRLDGSGRRSSDDSSLGPMPASNEGEVRRIDSMEADFQETPGRPSESISEFAEAYVQMMNDRDNGRQLGNSVLTPGGDEVGVPEQRSSSPGLSDHSSVAQPAQSATQPLLAPPKASTSSQSRASPSSGQQGNVPLGFGPSHPSISSSSGSNRTSNPDSPSHPLGQSVGLPSSSRQPRNNRSHRRRASHSGPLLLDDYDEDSLSGDDDMDDEDMDSLPRGRRGASRASSSSSKNARPSHSAASPPAAPSSLAMASPSSRNAPSWHSRKNSTSSARSGGSESSGRAYNRSRTYNSPPAALSPADRSSQHPLARSGSVSPLHRSQSSQQMQKTRSTLFYIRRRIHCMRAAAIIQLVISFTLSLVPFINLSLVLTRSQTNRNACQAPITPPSTTPTDPAIPIPQKEACFYFQHDMTSFLVVSGLWICLSLALSIMSVAASFMFYWRRFMRITLIASISMCFVTVIVMTWTICLLAFSFEWENWRGENNVMSRAFGSHHQAIRLRNNTLAFLIAVCFYWLLNFIISVICVHLNKFIMSKPRYCCWPLECGPTPRAKSSMPINNNFNGLAGPFSLGEARRAAGMDSDDEGEHHDDEGLPEAGISISKVPPKRLPSAVAEKAQQQPPPAQDLTPLLNALQGIQSTVHSLAAKVQAIEDKEATSSAAVDLNDPFAYGRRF